MAKRVIQDRFFWISFLLGGFFLSLTLWFDFTMDQSICHYVAWVWKQYKLPPYIGAWDLAFPGIFLIHRLALEIFGGSALGFRVFDFLIQMSGLMMIYYLGKTLSGREMGGFLACVFYSVYYYGLGTRAVGVRESFIYWLLLLSVVISFSRSKVWFRAISVGLLVGFAFLVKPFYGLFWPVFGVWFLIDGFKKRQRMVWLELFVFAFSCLFPSLLVILIYWHLNYLDELYRATIWFNFVVYSAWPLSHPKGMRLLWIIIDQVLLKEIFIFVSGIFGIYIARMRIDGSREKELFRILLVSALVCLIAYLIQGKYIDYHLIPFWGFMIIFAGGGYDYIGFRLASITRGARANLIKGIFYPGLIVLLITLNIDYSLIKFSVRYCFRSFENAYLAVRGTPLDAHESSNFRLSARFLERYMEPEDEIEFFGPYPMIPLLVKKKLPSRFCCVHHLLFLPRDGKMRALQKQWIQEYQSAVIKANPRYFVVCDMFGRNIFFNLSVSGLKEGLKMYFPALNNFFSDNYRLVAQFGSVEIYERKLK